MEQIDGIRGYSYEDAQTKCPDGYLENVVLALPGKMDAHFAALWNHWHTKFWSRKTVCSLRQEPVFQESQFFLVARVPFLAKSMIAITRKS